MLFIRICFALGALFVASGCTVLPSSISPELIAGKADQYNDLTKSQTVTVLDEPYLGAKAILLPRDAEFSTGIFTKQVVFNQRGSLEELCASVSKLTNLAVGVEDSASAAVSTELSDTELNAKLSGALAGTGKKAESSIKARGGGSRVVYEGTVKGLLDKFSAIFGLGWEYSAESGVVFSKTLIKTFTIWGAPGKITFSNKITNQSKETSSSGTSIGAFSSVSREDASLQTAQTHTTDLTIDIWAEVANGVKALLTPAGSTTINQAAGTITVKDSATAMKRISKFIAEINERLARQVALSIKVWSLEISDASDVGVNLQMLFENPDIKVFAGAMPLQWLGLGGELSAAIVDGKLKDSSAMLKALRSVGQATQVTSGGGIVMSNQPVPVQAIRREAYLAGAATSRGDYGETTALTPGEVTTGFAMTVIPHIMEGRRVVLQYTVNLSNLDEIAEFASGTARIQLPKISTRSFSQRMNLKIGQTLVLAGFEQEIATSGKTAGLLAIGNSKEYKKSIIIITIATENGDV